MDTATQTAPERPVYGRPYAEIAADLALPIPAKYRRTKKMGGNPITFAPWYVYTRILNYYAPGWSKRVVVTPIGGQLVVTVAISIPCAEGVVTREATGIEDDSVKGFGDTASNAESMAFRRACAQFGLGLHFYEDK